MLKNHFKYAWRQILKNRLISGINILGLGLGLAVGIFILLYIQHEYSYDQWLPDKENIYRVYRPYEGGAKGNLSTPLPLAKAVKEEVPGVVASTHVMQNYDMLVEYNKAHYSIENVWSVDSNFFKTFPLQFEKGNVITTTQKTDVAVLSLDAAQKIFGIENPIGQTILLENSHQLEIAGVLPSPKGQSHMNADMFIIERYDRGWWTGGGGSTYLRLGPSIDRGQVKSTIYDIAKREIRKEYIEDGDDPETARIPQWELQVLTDIHLGSQHLGENSSERGNPWQITIMSLIGILILLIAAINYMNLATAQLNVRAKEVSIRSITGADRKHLIGQFLTESVLITFFALIVGAYLANLFLPFFNEVTNRTISMSEIWNGGLPFMVLGLAFLTSMVSGVFPAFYNSKIQLADSLKTKYFADKKTGVYRNILITSQFAMSIGLVLFVSLVWMQVDYMLKKDLGFEQEQIAVFRINQGKTVDTFQDKKSLLEQIPGVASVSQISRSPGGRVPNYSMTIEGIEEETSVNLLFGDTDWNNTFQIDVKEGRFLSDKYKTDMTAAFVVNESFVKTFGIENPIGHQMKLVGDDKYSTIVGVIEDFHYEGLESEISPVAICARMEKSWMGAAAIRFETEDVNNSLLAASNTWKTIEPVFPVTYKFLDETFAQKYKSYEHFGKSLSYATFICLFLALIGLFGLTVFIIQRKTKEIGIRKILGASISNIVTMLSIGFLKLVFLAFLIAAPFAWYMMNNWLDNFAYRMEVQWWVFLLVGIMALLITFITVGIQAIRASISNPVESIRTD